MYMLGIVSLYDQETSEITSYEVLQMIYLFLLFIGVLLIASVFMMMLYAWVIISICAVIYVFSKEAVKSHKRKKLVKAQTVPQASISSRR